MTASRCTLLLGTILALGCGSSGDGKPKRMLIKAETGTHHFRALGHPVKMTYIKGQKTFKNDGGGNKRTVHAFDDYYYTYRFSEVKPPESLDKAVGKLDIINDKVISKKMVGGNFVVHIHNKYLGRARVLVHRKLDDRGRVGRCQIDASSVSGSKMKPKYQPASDVFEFLQSICMSLQIRKEK